jgi:MFS family permease
MLGVGSFCYGFGISPMYYSWGFFLPEMRADFALSETQSGLVFSVFSWIYHLVGPLVGFAMGRWGIRSVVSVGSLVGVVGFWMMSRADSFADCLFGYGVLGGLAIGFSTILPGQTLASNWFVRYRARALAVVLAGGAVVGFVVNKYFGPFMVQNFSWRTGWLVIAGISAVVALVAAIFIRSTPEEMGQHPDGIEPEQGAGENAPAATSDFEADRWTAGSAVRTYQFYVLVALSVAYGVPWSIISVYGRLHLEALGFATAVAGSILGARVLVSLLGRLSALGGDYVSPQKLLGTVLLIEGLGSAGLLVARTPAMAYLSVVLVGLGFGAAYVSIPVAYSAFYGRRAFGATVGARFALTGMISPAAPTLAGMASDWSGSYALAFGGMAALCIVGGVCAFWLPAPRLQGAVAAAA